MADEKTRKQALDELTARAAKAIGDSDTREAVVRELGLPKMHDALRQRVVGLLDAASAVSSRELVKARDPDAHDELELAVKLAREELAKAGML